MSSRNPSLAKPTGPGHNRPDLVCHHVLYHGLSCEEYEAMRERAGGRCEICKVDERETKRGFLVVDHFHGSGPAAEFTRGMLCDFCNNSVMQAYDGLKAWGANRRFEEAAREYERNSWEQPSEQALREMAARTEKLPAIRKVRRWPVKYHGISCPESIDLPLRKGPMAIAKQLRRYLTPKQVAKLVEFLTEPEETTR